MPKDRAERDHSENEDSDVEQLVEQLEKVEIDASKLTPLSPEVISKQVCVPLRSHTFVN